MAKITYNTKIDNVVSALPSINKVSAADLNEIKDSVNNLYDTRGGWVDYEDLTTSTTPINLTQNVWTDLTNDKAGSNTITTYKPTYIVGDLWDSASNTINLSAIGAGKVVIIRKDFDVYSNSSNTRIDARLFFPDTGKSIQFQHDNIGENHTTVRYSRTTQLFIKESEVSGGCKIQIKVDENNCTATIENFLITVLSIF